MTLAPQVYGQLHEAIRNADRLLLVAHKKPDGDTLGASSSVLNWLLREGKHVRVFCADLPPSAFGYIDNIHHYTNDPSVFASQYDVVVIFDSGDLRYCGVADHVPKLEPGYLLVNVDHHVTNEQFGQLNLVFTDASSTAEVVHRFYEANEILVDAKMATSLLTGLLTDTGNFSNAATTSGSMDAASKMFAAGARHTDIAKSLMHNKSVDSLKIWGLVLSRLHHNKKLDIVSTYILKDDLDENSADVADGIANFLNAVTGQTDTIMMLRELPTGEVKGSFRSATRDVSKLAKLLSGGGHKKAAGFTVKGRIEVTKEGPRIVS
ncbi:MAG: DHH family phosphoesterase [Patescibacteria group bacterium]